MEKPSISILMACYNAAPFLEATLRSVQEQTYPNYELVIVDDGSTDGSASKIESIAWKNVRLIRQANQGAAKARNMAVQNSTGQFIVFLDADDIISATHLEALLSRATAHSGCVALSRWDRFKSDPSEANFPSRETERDMTGPDWLELDWSRGEPMTQSGMLLLPRSLIEKHGAWDERLSLNDDFEFFARIISRSAGVRFAPDARLYYRSSIVGSLSGRKSRVAVESALLSLEAGTSHLLAVKDTQNVRRICANLIQAFDHRYFPLHSDLRAKARSRVAQLGGSDMAPDGPPGFQKLRPIIGWKAARLAQLAAERFRLNAAGRDAVTGGQVRPK